VDYPLHQAVQVRLPRQQFYPKGRIGSSPGAALVVQVPHTGPPVYPQKGPVRAQLPPQPLLRGRMASLWGAPVQNPAAGPVFTQETSPVQAQRPLLARGRVYVTAKPLAVIARVPPPFHPANQAIRARLPQQPVLRGHIAFHPGAPLRNPAPGPSFFQAVKPVRAPVPQVFSRGRVSGNAGTPAGSFTVSIIYNAVPGAMIPGGIWPGDPLTPGTGPPFYQQPFPARARLPRQPLLRGRISSNAGGPVSNPVIGSGPVFYPFRSPVRVHPVLPPRGHAGFNAGAALRNPQPGPAFAQAAQPARARIPQDTPRGRTGSNPGIRVQAAIPAPFYPAVQAVRAKLPQYPLLRGRVYSNPGTPVHNPQAGPVLYAAVQPVRARVRQNAPRGRIGSSPGILVPAAAPAQVYPLGGPVRARIPQIAPRGRTAFNHGGPVVNPVIGAGPPFYPRHDPARIRVILPPRGRIASCQGTPVRNPSPGPVFTPAAKPVQARFPLAVRGRITGNPGVPVVPPAVTVFYPRTALVQARIPRNAPRGRVYSGPGGPVRNPVPVAYPPQGPVRAKLPAQHAGRVNSSPGSLPVTGTGPVFRQFTRAVRVIIPLPPRGRTGSNPGSPVSPPTHPAPVYPQKGPVRARRPLPPKGRISQGNPGAPVRNPQKGPVFRPAVKPIRAIIPLDAPRGRTGTNPGGPVENIPFVTLRFRFGDPEFRWTYGTPEFRWEYSDPLFEWDTGSPEF
jgi:hypothetical protein